MKCSITGESGIEATLETVDSEAGLNDSDELKRLRQSKYIREVLNHVISPRTFDKRIDEMKRDNKRLMQQNNALKHELQLERAEVIMYRRQIEMAENV